VYLKKDGLFFISYSLLLKSFISIQIGEFTNGRQWAN
jgi:hypothetical protein